MMGLSLSLSLLPRSVCVKKYRKKQTEMSSFLHQNKYEKKRNVTGNLFKFHVHFIFYLKEDECRRAKPIYVAIQSDTELLHVTSSVYK